MTKTILLTGATDGIGFEAARMLVSLGHHVILHGRNPAKLDSVEASLRAEYPEASLDQCVADLSNLAEVQAMAAAVLADHPHLDVVINNAGTVSYTHLTLPTKA